MNRITSILLVLSIAAYSCVEKSKKQKTETGSFLSTENTIAKDSSETIQSALEVSNFELLQGKWQSMDDKTNFLIFEKNHRKEIAGDSDKWDDEIFILDEKCLNSNAPLIENEKDRYITCKESDLCWYIIELNSTSLSLSYVGRGNTLTYKRIN